MIIIKRKYKYTKSNINKVINLTKTTAAQNEVALGYHSVRGLHFLAVVFVVIIIFLSCFRISISSTKPLSV